MKSKVYYLMGELHGVWQWWDINGTLRVDGEYQYGKKSGVWKYYDKDGKLVNTKNFLN